jgi:hypothetical protein
MPITLRAATSPNSGLNLPRACSDAFSKLMNVKSSATYDIPTRYFRRRNTDVIRGHPVACTEKQWLRWSMSTTLPQLFESAPPTLQLIRWSARVLQVEIHRRERWPTRRTTSKVAKAKEVRAAMFFAKRTHFRTKPALDPALNFNAVKPALTFGRNEHTSNHKNLRF